MDEAEERICDLEDRNFEFIHSEEKKKEEWNRVKKTEEIYGTTLKETICEWSEFWKEKGLTSLLKEIITEKVPELRR